MRWPNLSPPAIVALRNEKGSYSYIGRGKFKRSIVALRNEKGSYSYTCHHHV